MSAQASWTTPSHRDNFDDFNDAREKRSYTKNTKFEESVIYTE